MANVLTVGNKSKILDQESKLKRYWQCINSIANKTEDQVDDFLTTHFSGMSSVEKQGQEILTKAIWAEAKMLKLVMMNLGKKTE